MEITIITPFLNEEKEVKIQFYPSVQHQKKSYLLFLLRIRLPMDTTQNLQLIHKTVRMLNTKSVLGRELQKKKALNYAKPSIF